MSQEIKSYTLNTEFKAIPLKIEAKIIKISNLGKCNYLGAISKH